ncbi:MAG TPA: DUF3604 domain-containing protein [bacterium]|uniref:DUF3604 domain-containing protein n=1 Tax=candidate division TA06 bacterium ADurb.Bin417 TaxID=1852828 RepID=A0A1V5MLH7_UNCT6|nr:MAG: hypothetical protein BWY73_00129 [candidate division TA06 bacterium ADurb.Bin417]HNS49059.1 DUF3604 domain-containing protein [bacterium]
MDEYRLLWGDLHTHFEDPDHDHHYLDSGRENIDFCAVLGYPFCSENRNGLVVESVGPRPEHPEYWRKLLELVRVYHAPGRFLTLPGYEWHGDRARYGDHNVIYFESGGRLDAAWRLEDLYRNLAGGRALVIPHHTGYAPAYRGKDWSVHDDSLSPVMEIYSIHGSSEGCETPFPMERNTNLGPRVSAGTFQAGLARGCRLGVIASNDGPGLPGRWGRGRAAAWVKEFSREGLLEAFRARRTYAVTGDRIELRFRVNGAEMGASVPGGAAVEAEAEVIGAAALDRLELVQNGRVAATYNHSGRWETKAARERRFKVALEVGWGPHAKYGFKLTEKFWRWQGSLAVAGGRLAGLENRFTLPGQRAVLAAPGRSHFELASRVKYDSSPTNIQQGLVFEIEGGAGTGLDFDIEGLRFRAEIGELLAGTRFVPLIRESEARIRKEFGLDGESIGNPDPYILNCRKIKLHRAVPESGYRVGRRFRNLRLDKGLNYFYLRASQLNGQYAWSSPVWVTRA